MASVALKFTPPYQEDLVALRILECATQEGTFQEIERVENIGSYPNYIDNYTTDQATAGDYWFSIQWEDAKQALTEVSAPIHGGTTRLISHLVDRVLLRDPTASESIVVQECESVIEEVLHVDPYSEDDGSVSYQMWTGMTYLALARVGITVLITSAGSQSFTAGLVSIKSTSGTINQDVIDRYIKEANRILGLNLSVVGIMAYLESRPTPNFITGRDISRSLIEVT